MPERGGMGRVWISAVLLCAAFSGLGSRLAFLHLGPHDAARRQVEEKQTWREELPVRRGSIYDGSRTRNILALDLPVKHICADPTVLRAATNPVAAASRLAPALRGETDALAVRLKRAEGRYVRLKRYACDETVNAVRALDMPGVFFEDVRLRHYPQGTFMCHVLGFVNHEGVPGAGIELGMERYLKGCPGLIESRKNALRQELVVRRDRHIPPVAGANVVLTLDQTVQYFVEQALDTAMAAHTARAAWAIVQDVRTGRILAMASRPAFDLNAFYDGSPETWLNRAIGCVHEPGSTLKAVTIAAALDQHTVTEHTPFDCEQGAWTYAGKILHDYHPAGVLSVADGIKKSSNILTAKVALTLGEERLYRYMRSFGLGRPLGVDLPGEEGGILHPVRDWSRLSIARVSIGHGVAVTALQILGAFNAIANGGRLMRPYVVDRVTRPDGTTISATEPEVLGHPLAPETARLMRRLLARVCEDGGTGARARVDGYRVAGKTGTAQKPEAGGYSQTRYVASFVGYLPAERPEIGIVVVIDEPQPVHTGGRVAAPVFAEIAARTVRYLNVPPAPAEPVLHIAQQRAGDGG
jgi:cell division protein FtsI (penicillin-binding protein 3)